MRKIMLRAAAVGTAMMLMAAGCKQSNDTLYVLLPPPKPAPDPVPVFTGIEALQIYLEGQGETTIDKPIAVRLSDVDLSEQETSIENLFTALAAAGKYVDLDLSGCTKLTEWGAYRDAGADRVVSLVLPDSVTKIADGTSTITFAFFTSLKVITANKTETVGNYAFRGCAALASADLPAATVIGDGAFFGCAALASVSLPAATAIGDYAFSGCAALASINLPAATVIGNHAFRDCAALETLSLPAAVTFGNYAFSSCAALKTLSLPAAVTLGEAVFYNCTALETLSLPAAVTFGNWAFSSCAALKTISLPAAVTVGNTVFGGCTALETLSLPAATAIGDAAFSGCTALASISLPSAATIGNYAFRTCFALASLTLGTTIPTLGGTAFYEVGKDTEAGFTIYVPDGAAQTALEAEIATAGSDWYKALKTDAIGTGKYKGVAVTS